MTSRRGYSLSCCKPSDVCMVAIIDNLKCAKHVLHQASNFGFDAGYERFFENL
jgi:hypothetical protein